VIALKSLHDHESVRSDCSDQRINASHRSHRPRCVNGIGRCGNFAPNNGWCTTGQLAFTAYSVATGKLDRVLYSYQGGCHFGTATVIWARSAALAIGWIAVSKPVTPYPPIANEVGVLSPGNFTSLPGLKVGTGEENPSMIAF